MRRDLAVNFNSIDLIILDVDATLIDTADFIERTFIQTFEKNGVKVTAEKLRKVVTKPAIDIFNELSPQINPHEALRYLSLLQSSLFHTVQTLPEAKEFLKKSKEKNKKIATVTSRRRDTGVELLKLHGLHEYIDQSIFFDDVTHAKPHPESILKVLSHFKEKKENAVMIGDSAVDIEAGKNAGVKTIGVLTGFDNRTLHTSNPDILLKDIAEVSRLFHA